jgi:N-acetylglucosamine-6-phosphate deacetylase
LAPEDLTAAIEAARRWDGLILPGLVDIHCHGGGGQSFPDAASPAEAMAAVQEHLRHGTTSLVASLVTDAPEVLERQTALLAELCRQGALAGIHLEGPFLSERRAGAQDPAKMQVPDPALVRRIAQVADGWLATMTVAPELPGVAAGPNAPDLAATESGAGAAGGVGTASSSATRRPSGAEGADSRPETVVEALAQVGAAPSFGHTDASAEEMGRAVDAADRALRRAEAESAAGRVGGGGGQTEPGDGIGRRATATHLFNGMRPIHHRDPGPALEALAQAAAGKMVVELIADGVHLDPRTVRDVFELVGWQGVALVTDAMAAAGMPDGDYQLGPAAVTVADGVARLSGGGSIAGGTAHLIDVVRSAWRDSGVALEEAVAAASVTPARVLGQSGRRGALAPGRRADLVLADGDLVPVEVYQAGRRVGG